MNAEVHTLLFLIKRKRDKKKHIYGVIYFEEEEDTL